MKRNSILPPETPPPVWPPVGRWREHSRKQQNDDQRPRCPKPNAPATVGRSFPDYKPELKKGKVNKRLIEVFDQNAISLSSNSEIYEFPKQKTWKIEDGRESYIIKEVDKQLKVYVTDFSQYNLKYRQDPKQFVFLPMIRFRLSFMMIYYWLSGIYTALNIGLLVAKFNSS